MLESGQGPAFNSYRKHQLPRFLSQKDSPSGHSQQDSTGSMCPSEGPPPRLPIPTAVPRSAGCPIKRFVKSHAPTPPSCILRAVLGIQHPSCHPIPFPQEEPDAARPSGLVKVLL